jgi:probable rRNA maturation factor
MTVLIKESQRLPRADRKLVKKITEDLLAFLKLQDRDLSILFIDNTGITALNREYFGRDRATNVISFSYMDGLPSEVVGDIIISLERAREESDRLAIPYCERVFALIIHGLLHIMGFDHERGGNEARRMKYREKKLLGFVTSHPLYRQLAGSPA